MTDDREPFREAREAARNAKRLVGGLRDAYERIDPDRAPDASELTAETHWTAKRNTIPEQAYEDAAKAIDPTAFDETLPNHEGAVREYRREQARLKAQLALDAAWSHLHIGKGDSA